MMVEKDEVTLLLKYIYFTHSCGRLDVSAEDVVRLKAPAAVHKALQIRMPVGCKRSAAASEACLCGVYERGGWAEADTCAQTALSPAPGIFATHLLGGDKAVVVPDVHTNAVAGSGVDDNLVVLGRLGCRLGAAPVLLQRHVHGPHSWRGLDDNATTIALGCPC